MMLPRPVSSRTLVPALCRTFCAACAELFCAACAGLVPSLCRACADFFSPPCAGTNETAQGGHKDKNSCERSYVYHSERAVNHLDHFSVESRGQCSDTKKEDAKFKCCSVASNVLHNTTTSCLVLLFIILSNSETPGAYDKRAFEWLGLKTDES